VKVAVGMDARAKIAATGRATVQDSVGALSRMARMRRFVSADPYAESVEDNRPSLQSSWRLVLTPWWPAAPASEDAAAEWRRESALIVRVTDHNGTDRASRSPFKANGQNEHRPEVYLLLGHFGQI
jgi:hypothetical protein